MSEIPVAQLLARAIQLVREKRRAEARDLLLQVIERDERSEQAWLWLSGVVDDPRDMQIALANALTINPNNEQALRGLQVLRQRYGDLLEAEAAPAAAAAEPSRPAVTERPAPVAVQTEEEVVVFKCYKCQADVEVLFGEEGAYQGPAFCFSCRAAVHCCDNCLRRREVDCKEREGIRGPAAAKTRNACQQWRPV